MWDIHFSWNPTKVSLNGTMAVTLPPLPSRSRELARCRLVHSSTSELGNLELVYNTCVGFLSVR